MRAGKSLLFFAFLALVVFLSGCIKITAYQKISSGGISESTTSVDFSKFKSFGGTESQAGADQFSKSCDEFNRQAIEKNSLDFSCNFDSEKFVLTTKTREKLEYPALEIVDGIPFNTYRLDPTKSPDFLNSMNSSMNSLGRQNSGLPQGNMVSPDFNSEEFAKQMQALVGLSFEFDYTVEMPGEITLAQGGRIEENRAKYNFAEFMELARQKKSILVESRELNPLAIAGVGLLLVVVIAGAGLFFFFVKKPGFFSLESQPQKWAQSLKNTRVEEVTRLLYQKKHLFSALEIRAALKQSDFSEEEIQKILSKLEN